MKKTLLLLSLIATMFAAKGNAQDDNTVEILYSGTTASVSVAANIAPYVTVESGDSPHVRLKQSDDFAGIDATADNPDGEIFYVLSGVSSDGEFYLEGAYKCTVELNGLNITNPTGPAINLQNGKRVAVSAKKEKTNTITDGSNEDYNGCLHCKGHLKFKGKGTLNVWANSRHGVYSKEYLEVKNLTLNIYNAPKDGIHCKNYMLVESGTVTLTSCGDDAIQVELDGSESTGPTPEHEDEDSGNFYQEGGTLAVNSCAGKAVKADGDISLTGGSRNFTDADTEQHADIDALKAVSTDGGECIVLDLQGRRTAARKSGLYIVKEGKEVRKVLIP
jgi:hypothetical protein